MNLKVFRLSFVLLIAAAGSAASQTATSVAGPAGQDVVYIKGIRFADQLLEKWVAEYSRAHPGASVAIASGEAAGQAIEALPATGNVDGGGSGRIVFGRFAVLPIAGKDNVLPDELKKKKLNGKRIKELFFEKDLLADEGSEAKDKYAATVYSGNGSYSVSHSFAEHFGYEASSLKGKKIAGDDIYLNAAVKKDGSGVSFNNLNYIFNLESRRLNDGIVLLPLDVKKEYAEALGALNLDATIALLENNNIDLIPVEELAFVLPENVSQAALRFLEWALLEGQDYINRFGFLRLDTKTIARQQQKISALGEKLLANK
jgi:ABC-type phosphate transport system substrate-binding protein